MAKNVYIFTSKSGGAIVREYPSDSEAFKHSNVLGYQVYKVRNVHKGDYQQYRTGPDAIKRVRRM